MLYKISDIEKLYPDWYDKEFPLSYDDQKFIWENIPLFEEDEIKLRKVTTSESVLNGSVNGSYKRQENFEQKLSKQQVVERLGDCNYHTPPKKIAFYLETLFGRWDQKPEHWLYIAQHYTPKTINSVRFQMVKAFQGGNVTIKIPGAYFTSIIKHKQKRKVFRNTNGGRKQQLSTTHRRYPNEFHL